MGSKKNDPAPLGAEALLDRKLALMKEVFAVTRQELLLVDLDGLTPLLERKELLIAEIGRIDEELAASGHAGGTAGDAVPQSREIAEVVTAILENERTLEARINEEFALLRRDLHEFDRQTRLRSYLEGQKRTKGKVNIKK